MKLRMYVIYRPHWGCVPFYGTRAQVSRIAKRWLGRAKHSIILVPRELEKKVALGDAVASIEGCRAYLAKKVGEDYGAEVYPAALLRKNVRSAALFWRICSVGYVKR